MKTLGACFGKEIRVHSSQNEEVVSDSQQVSLDSSDSDSFEELSPDKKFHSYRSIIKNAKAMRDKPVDPDIKVPWPQFDAVAKEEKFIANPTTKAYFKLANDFASTMRVVGHQKYSWIDTIGVKPHMPAMEDVESTSLSKKDRKLEYWHIEHDAKRQYQETKEELKARRRRDKIAEKGLGRSGRLTKKVAKAKAASFYAKNNLTLRGNMFKLTHKMCPKNIYEIMPRYGYRKGAHIAVRVSQFTVTTFLTGLGYALTPATYGVSKIVTDHLRTVVTLSGEVITHKIAGAENHKCMVHAGLRGVQLEIPRLVPFAGDIINIGENIAFGGAAIGIVSTTIADALLAHFSTRYTSTLNVDDIGDSRCLAELNNRIDYLSQFLLPYGQYLLLKETDLDTRKQLKKDLKENFALLRDLEKKKVESLNYYRLALVAEKLPESHREIVRMHVNEALPDTRINTHRIVKRCLAELIAKDETLTQSIEEQKLAA